MLRSQDILFSLAIANLGFLFSHSMYARFFSWILLLHSNNNWQPISLIIDLPLRQCTSPLSSQLSVDRFCLWQVMYINLETKQRQPPLAFLTLWVWFFFCPNYPEKGLFSPFSHHIFCYFVILTFVCLECLWPSELILLFYYCFFFWCIKMFIVLNYIKHFFTLCYPANENNKNFHSLGFSSCSKIW